MVKIVSLHRHSKKRHHEASGKDQEADRMTRIIVAELFGRGPLDPRLTWSNRPAALDVRDGVLVVHMDAETDFWQRTHYGFRADNGHFLSLDVRGDFVLSTHVLLEPAHQYDQAGLMVRLSAASWLKTSVEFQPNAPSQLGAVVTNHGYSDWSTQAFERSPLSYSLRVRREANDYVVEWSAEETPGADDWAQLRVAHLCEDDGQGPVACGLYACGPKGAGGRALLSHLTVIAGRLDSVG